MLDALLHIPLALFVALVFHAHPVAGCIIFLWIREAAQRNPGNLIDGLNVFEYSRQKHLEIWPPGVAAGLLSGWLL